MQIFFFFFLSSPPPPNKNGSPYYSARGGGFLYIFQYNLAYPSSNVWDPCKILQPLDPPSTNPNLLSLSLLFLFLPVLPPPTFAFASRGQRRSGRHALALSASAALGTTCLLAGQRHSRHRECASPPPPPASVAPAAAAPPLASSSNSCTDAALCRSVRMHPRHCGACSVVPSSMSRSFQFTGSTGEELFDFSIQHFYSPHSTFCKTCFKN